MLGKRETNITETIWRIRTFTLLYLFPVIKIQMDYAPSYECNLGTNVAGLVIAAIKRYY